MIAAALRQLGLRQIVAGLREFGKSAETPIELV